MFRNITFLNDLCPINSVNTMLFDFGTCITVLQSGISGSINYFQSSLIVSGGVVLLELLISRRAISHESPNVEKNLANFFLCLARKE